MLTAVALAIALGDPTNVVSGVLFLAAWLVSLYGAPVLAHGLAGRLAAAVCLVLALVPCLNLFVLVVLNQLATGHLQRAGVKVGWLGAKSPTDGEPTEQRSR